jgi:hypothetical protein
MRTSLVAEVTTTATTANGRVATCEASSKVFLGGRRSRRAGALLGDPIHPTAKRLGIAASSARKEAAGVAMRVLSAVLRVYVHPFGDFTASNQPGARAAIVRSPWARRAPPSWYSGIGDGCSRLSRVFSALTSSPAGISQIAGRPPRLSASPRIRAIVHARQSEIPAGCCWLSIWARTGSFTMSRTPHQSALTFAAIATTAATTRQETASTEP